MPIETGWSKEDCTKYIEGMIEGARLKFKG